MLFIKTMYQIPSQEGGQVPGKLPQRKMSGSKILRLWLFPPLKGINDLKYPLFSRGKMQRRNFPSTEVWMELNKERTFMCFPHNVAVSFSLFQWYLAGYWEIYHVSIHMISQSAVSERSNDIRIEKMKQATIQPCVVWPKKRNVIAKKTMRAKTSIVVAIHMSSQ